MNKIEPCGDTLKIIIPTYKRESVKQQISYSMIPDEYKQHTYFAVREERLEKMKEVFPDANYLVIPPGAAYCISDTRQWILDNANVGSKHWYFDDDIKLFQKRDENFRIRGNIELDHFKELYDLIDEKLNQYAYVGLAPKLFNNLCTNQFAENTAIYACFAARVDVLKQANARYDYLCKISNKITVSEDKWMCAYLLSKGYKNLQLNEWVYDPKGGEGAIGDTDDTLGGNFGLKTHEGHFMASEIIMREFKGFAYMKTSKTKDKLGNVIGEFSYPIIRWNKLYESAVSRSSDPFDFS